jgi:hypothetical protein
LFPFLTLPLREVNPDKVEEILAKPFKVASLPDHLTAGQKSTMSHMLGFKPWTDSARRKVAETVPTRVRMIEVAPNAPVIPEGIPAPTVPTAVLMVRPEKTMEGKYARAVLSKEEYDLYVHTWVEWLTQHPEWNLPEDLNDLGHICMEQAMQFRLLRLSQQKNTDVTVSYNASFKRQQQARENLTARRVDRTGTKAAGSSGNKTIVNVAVLSGEVPPEEVARRKLKQLAHAEGEDDFLNNTITRRQVTINEATPDEV